MSIPFPDCFYPKIINLHSCILKELGYKSTKVYLTSVQTGTGPLFLMRTAEKNKYLFFFL